MTGTRSKKRTFVIVGASLAGAKAAETLRDEGFDGRVVLIGDEPERPYERPALSKDYLRSAAADDKLYVHDEAFYDTHDIELRTGVTVRDIGELEFDRLLLATGSAPRRLQVPGADLDGVHYLRTWADSDRLRKAASTAGRVAVIGGGWIGSEVAASLREMGRDVVVLDPMSAPLESALGPELGGFFRDVHIRHGVEFEFGAKVVALRGTDRVEAVETEDGRVVKCDLAVVGIGVVPRVELAERAGLTVDNGVVVDEALRTSRPDVFAAGDVASASHPLLERRIRIEHWANALNQGPAAARSMLGIPVVYDRLPYFFSDQYDLGLEYVGDARPGDAVEIDRGDGDALVARWRRHGRLVAGLHVNTWDATDRIREEIELEARRAA